MCSLCFWQSHCCSVMLYYDNISSHLESVFEQKCPLGVWSISEQCHVLRFMCLHLFHINSVLCSVTFYSLQRARVCFRVCFRSSSDVRVPHRCSLCTALCSGWSRSGRVVRAGDPSAVERLVQSLPCLPSSMPRSSWWSV